MGPDKNEVLRYLGYKDHYLDNKTLQTVEECIIEIKTLARPRSVYSIYNISYKTEMGVMLKESTLFLGGQDILSHLNGAEKCILLGATLGIEVDRQINLYSKHDLTRSIILDACGTALIEAYCDSLQIEIGFDATKSGYYLTPRFSPGYGDLKLELQADISRVLRLYETIGISLTESFLMLPRKSITAIIGLQKNLCNTWKHNCTACEKKDCLYRR